MATVARPRPQPQLLQTERTPPAPRRGRRIDRLEAAIGWEHFFLVMATTWPQRRARWARLRELLAQRSPERVAQLEARRMERVRGVP